MRKTAPLLPFARVLFTQAPSRDEVLHAIHRAAGFCRHKVSTEGGAGAPLC